MFVDTLAKRFSRWHSLRMAPLINNSGDLVIPANVTLAFLLACSPELNPQEYIWEEIRENIFKNYAAKSMNAVCDKLVEAALCIERNPKMMKSMTSS